MSDATDHNPTALLDAAWQALQTKRWADAVELCKDLLTREPSNVDGHRALSIGLWAQGRSADALALLETAARSGVVDADLWSDLGVLRYSCQDWIAAVDAFSEAIRLNGGSFTAMQGYAESLLRLHRYSEAARAFTACVELAPERKSLGLSLAQCLLADRELEEAARIVEDYLSAEPASERGLLLLASIRHRQLRPELARELTEAAVRSSPDSFTARARLALACWNTGDLAEAALQQAAALRLQPTDRDLHSNLSWLSLHDPNQSAGELLQIHRGTAEAWAGDATPRRIYRNVPDPDRKLRIGYLSGEFTRGPAFCFLASWLRQQDRESFESFYYMSRPIRDWHTEQFQNMADHWQDVAALSDEAVLSQIVADEIDILVDLSGHFDSNRLGVFFARPAPVQITFPNYPSTTGVTAIDYIFTDSWTTPAGSEWEYAEQPFRLPAGYLMYEPGVELPPVGPLPARSNRYVTFGVFQRPGKYHPAFWSAAAEVLRRVPESRLLIHFDSVELDESPSAQRKRLLDAITPLGVAPERIVMRGSMDLASHMKLVGEVDIALDSFPYNGQTTTCDCLYMGVPVVTLRGTTHVSRVGEGLLARAGLEELVAQTVGDYAETAVRFATDLDRLENLRHNLRSQATGGLGAGHTLSREIEHAYRSMWKRWCAQQAAPETSVPAACESGVNPVI